MKPPICCICDKKIDNNKGGLIQFKLTKEEKQRSMKFKQPGFVGHPPGLEWFCQEHYNLALNYKHLTLAEAIIKLTEN